MGEDVSAGMKIAIILIILCALVSIVFSILCITKNITAIATANYQNDMNAMQNMYWDDYNQKTVTGNQVQTLLRTCTEKEIAIVISSSRYPAEFKGGVNYGVALSSHLQSKDVTGGSTVYYGKDAPTETSTYSKDVTSQASKFYHDTKDSCYRAQQYKEVNSTVLTYRNDVKSAYEKTSTVYINPTHKYVAYLIKDASGTNIGVHFVQKEG